MNTKKKDDIETPIVEANSKSLMPFDDPVYVEYYEKLQKFFPLATFIPSMPEGAPTSFFGGKYSFFVNVPIVVNIQRSTGNFKNIILNRLLLANIIDPPKYEEVLQYKKHEDSEHLQFWKHEIPTKNPGYFSLQEFCKNKNIILFESLYIDKIKNRIQDLHTLLHN